MLEAMALGMPVLALSTTEAPEAVPPEAGVVSCDLSRLRDVAQQWLDDPATARQHGEAARAHVLTRYSLDRFLDSWDRVLKEVTS
jgi:glycosyltransferase involved in cell wall biosynthesis